MTSRELLSLILRRWYLVLLGAVLCFAALHLTVQRPGVYWTSFQVIVLAPTYEEYPNQLEDPHFALAPMAGVLVSDWNGSERGLLTASGDTTLFGEGLRQGVRVRMPNQGSQWRPLYTSPIIDVQVVDRDPRVVEESAHRVYTELTALLQRRQDGLGIRPSIRMATLMSPAAPNIEYVAGSRTRAVGAAGIAGVALTGLAIYWIERLVVWRRLARNKRPILPLDHFLTGTQPLRQTFRFCMWT